MASGKLLKGGQTVNNNFHLDEIPVYVKAGSIIPMYGDTLRNLQSNAYPVTINVYPSAGDVISKAEYYEDAGNDNQYALHYAVTPLTAERRGSKLIVRVGARKGNYQGMPAKRIYQIKAVASVMPKSVLVDGQNVSYRYDGMTLSLIVDIGNVGCEKEKTVEICYPSNNQCVANGEIGQMRRLRENVSLLKERDANIVLTDDLANMESVGRAITYAPSSFTQKMEFFHDRFLRLNEVLKAQKLNESDYKLFIDYTY